MARGCALPTSCRKESGLSDSIRLAAAEAAETVVEEERRKKRFWPEMWFLMERKREMGLR